MTHQEGFRADGNILRWRLKIPQVMFRTLSIIRSLSILALPELLVGSDLKEIFPIFIE